MTTHPADILIRILLALVCVCGFMLAVLGWLSPDGCPAADVIFHPEACEVRR